MIQSIEVGYIGNVDRINKMYIIKFIKPNGETLNIQTMFAFTPNMEDIMKTILYSTLNIPTFNEHFRIESEIFGLSHEESAAYYNKSIEFTETISKFFGEEYLLKLADTLKW